MPSLYVVANQVVGSNGHLQIVRANGATWTGSTNRVEVEAVSYTHLTLPTSDLV